MALGAITLTAVGVLGSQAPVFLIPMSFAGDGTYPANGTAGFQAAVRAKMKSDVEVLGIIPQDCGGYVPCYDKANDKLKVYEGDYNPAACGPLTENATADLSAVTFNLIVIAR